MKHAMDSLLFRKKARASAVHPDSERRMLEAAEAEAEALAIRARGAAIARRTALIWTREDLASGETALSMIRWPATQPEGPCEPP